MRRFAFLALILTLAFDRLFKYIAFQQSLLNTGEIARFGLLSFTPFLNNRLAFSLPLPSAIITILSLCAILMLMVYFFRLQTFFQRTALSFVILGALSNLFDRIAYGSVIDYLSVLPHGFFNIADMMVGGGISAFLLIKKRH